MTPILAAAESSLTWLFPLAAIVLFGWLVASTLKKQKRQAAQMDEAMAQNRESQEIGRRSLELSEQRLIAQVETNRLLERLIELASQRDRV